MLLDATYRPELEHQVLYLESSLDAFAEQLGKQFQKFEGYPEGKRASDSRIRYSEGSCWQLRPILQRGVP